jgi:hypothetical protein
MMKELIKIEFIYYILQYNNKQMGNSINKIDDFNNNYKKYIVNDNNIDNIEIINADNLYNNKLYHNADSDNGYHFTYIVNDEEMNKAYLLIERLKIQLHYARNYFVYETDKENEEYYKSIIENSYNDEINWLYLKIDEYRLRK